MGLLDNIHGRLDDVLDRVEGLAVGPQVYVSPSGNDNKPGTTPELPKLTITAALAVLPKQGGGRVNLSGRVYVENVQITQYTGLSSRPLVIRSLPGEQAFIDATVAGFREVNNDDWIPVDGHAGEFMSATTYPAP